MFISENGISVKTIIEWAWFYYTLNVLACVVQVMQSFGCKQGYNQVKMHDDI